MWNNQPDFDINVNDLPVKADEMIATDNEFSSTNYIRHPLDKVPLQHRYYSQQDLVL
jgi:hypothetical protein